MHLSESMTVSGSPSPSGTPLLQILLVSELYPPAVGGSAVLFENTYSRCSATNVTVLTDAASTARTGGAITAVVPATLRTPSWGLVNFRGTRHHLETARTILRASKQLDPTVVVHCGRALPEGVEACDGSPLCGSHRRAEEEGGSAARGTLRQDVRPCQLKGHTPD